MPESRGAFVGGICGLWLVTTVAWIPVAQAGKDDRPGEDPLRMVEAISREVEALRGWTYRHPVQKGVYSEEELRGFIRDQMAKDYPEDELHWNEVFLRAIGALPDTVDLQETVTEVLLSQVGGFYNPETETFYMIDRKGTEYPLIVDKVLIAHELTHALDDQYVSLDSLLDARDRTQDGEFVAGALVEGSATEIMSRYVTQAQLSGDLRSEDLQAMMRSEMDRSRVFLEAPPYFQTLLANYTCGMNFLLEGKLAALLGGDGVSAGENFLRAVADPPRSSEQILHPEKYWDPALRDAPVLTDDAAVETVLADLGYRVPHRNTAGEVLVAVLTTPPDRALNPLAAGLPGYWTNPAATGWGGDRYYVVEPVAGPGPAAEPGPAVPGGSDPEPAGVWITLWDTPADCEEFAKVYAAAHPGLGGTPVPLGTRGMLFTFGLEPQAAAALARALTPERIGLTRGGEPWSPQTAPSR